MQPNFSQNLIAGFNDRIEKVVVKMFESYYPVILQKVKDRIGDTHDSHDLTLEVITRILEHTDPFETVKTLDNFMYTVILTVCEDEHRDKLIRKNNERNLTKHFINLEDQAMEKLQIDYTCQHLTYIATELLPAKCKQVYMLSFMHEMSNRQIAEKLNISEDTVKNHKTFAYNKLRMEFPRRAGEGKGKFLFLFSIPLYIIYLLLQKIIS